MFSEWEINFFEILKKLVAWFYRQPRFAAILQTLAQPINFANGLFVDLRNAIIDKLKWNTQIVQLEKLLNLRFGIPYDPATRDADIASHSIIWIQSDNKLNHYLYNDIENRPMTWLFNDSETTPVYFENDIELYASNSFIIHIPAMYGFDPIWLRDLVNTYRLASKSFTVDTY